MGPCAAAMMSLAGVVPFAMPAMMGVVAFMPLMAGVVRFTVMAGVVRLAVPMMAGVVGLMSFVSAMAGVVRLPMSFMPAQAEGVGSAAAVSGALAGVVRLPMSFMPAMAEGVGSAAAVSGALAGVVRFTVMGGEMTFVAGFAVVGLAGVMTFAAGFALAGLMTFATRLMLGSGARPASFATRLMLGGGARPATTFAVFENVLGQFRTAGPLGARSAILALGLFASGSRTAFAALLAVIPLRSIVLGLGEPGASNGHNARQDHRSPERSHCCRS